jgi:hypothetical protein
MYSTLLKKLKAAFFSRFKSSIHSSMSFSTLSWILHSIPTQITFTNILFTTVGILSISSWLTKRMIYNNNNNNNKNNNNKDEDNSNDVVNSNGTKIICYHVGESLPYTTTKSNNDNNNNSNYNNYNNNNSNKCIYLDYNATTPIFPEVYQSMIPFLTYNFGNPSSSHSYAIPSRLALQNARLI